MADEDLPKVMAVRLDGKLHQLWDLPIEAVQTIADKHDGVTWLSVIMAPLSSLTLAADVVRAVAEKLDTPVPPIGTARQLWDLFERVDDDLPVEYVEGIPKVDGLVTTGS